MYDRDAGHGTDERLRWMRRLGPLAAVVLVLLALPQVVAAPLPTSASAHAGPLTSNPYVCPFTTTEFATARDVNLAPPPFALAAGDSLTSTYEFEIVNSTVKPIHLHLTIPSFFAKFPLTNGSALSAYLPPRTMTLTTTLSWTSGSLATKTLALSTAAHFSGASATMSTQFLAIMGDTPYQTMTLAFRWDWSVTFASNGTTVTSPWSVVSIGGNHPTTFYPAPTVQLVSTSNKTVAIGQTFSTYLSGAISQTRFHSVLEYASTGNVMRNTPTDTPLGNATPDLVAVKILPATGPLSPNGLLDHVRDVCSALLFSISVKAVYAASANISVHVLPSSCGSISLGGKSFANGATAAVAPSSTALSLSAGTCTGHTFLGWNFTNGFWVTSGHSASTTATVSASGGVTARFS
jgi:hypothetical protein